MSVTTIAGQLTVVGGASVDTLHLAGGEVRTAGGAGLYTVLAARLAGAEVAMVAPRPSPMPPELAAAARVIDWSGPPIGGDELPHFEISYSGDGQRALEVIRPGSEGRLDPKSVVAGLGVGAGLGSQPGPVYVIPLTDPELQLRFVHEVKRTGRWVGCGTYPCGARAHRDVVRAAFEVADAFFCNEEEAEILFGTARPTTRAGRLLFVTRGERGVTVAQGEHLTDVPAVPATEIDPTGAGDAFCGGTLAALARGEHPVIAARQGTAVAARLVTGVGPAALLDSRMPPEFPADSRLELDNERIDAVAGWLAGAPQVRGFDFCGESFPDPGSPAALDFFFAQTLQQFGFWFADETTYREPMIALAGGAWRKGSDYLWFVYKRLAARDPRALSLIRHQTLARDELDRWYRSDDGSNPVPASDLHWQLARQYGADLAEMGETPESLLERANASDRPAATLLRLLDHVGGYKEDPLRKKSALLALVLRQRPERFLRREKDDDLPPIVDYHIQRSCLRMGLVVVQDEQLEQLLAGRRILAAADEAAVRAACYRAVAEVQAVSRRSMAAVDWFFFQNRKRCPEMSVPDCSACEVESVCAQRKALFQPVFRTTFY